MLTRQPSCVNKTLVNKATENSCMVILMFDISVAPLSLVSPLLVSPS